MPNGIITTYTIRYIVDGNSMSMSRNVSYNGEEVSAITLCSCRHYNVITQTQSYDITGLSPYQLVTVTITATNGGGTSNSSDDVSGRSSEEGSLVF